MEISTGPLLPGLILKSAWGRAAVRSLGWGRAEAVARVCLPLLRPGDRLLDVGAGTGQIARRLRSRGFTVQTCDIVDLSCYRDMPPLLFDGRRLPNPEGSFDVGLLLFVLHHASDPRALLAEVARVASRVVVFEDLHVSPGNDRRRGLIDAVLTGERGSTAPGPRSDAEWKSVFGRQGLRLLSARHTSLFPCFHQAVYLLEARDRIPSTADPGNGESGGAGRPPR